MRCLLRCSRIGIATSGPVCYTRWILLSLRTIQVFRYPVILTFFYFGIDWGAFWVMHDVNLIVRLIRWIMYRQRRVPRSWESLSRWNSCTFISRCFGLRTICWFLWNVRGCRFVIPKAYLSFRRTVEAYWESDGTVWSFPCKAATELFPTQMLKKSRASAFFT